LEGYARAKDSTEIVKLQRRFNEKHRNRMKMT